MMTIFIQKISIFDKFRRAEYPMEIGYEQIHQNINY